MDTKNLLYVLGLLALAVVIVILLLRFMRARHPAEEIRASPKKSETNAVAAPHATLRKDEQDYLDSSHIGGPIVPGGRDALETWRSNKKK